ncbi:MAG: glycosyltransferase [Gammaproteobacteria bacterium]|nr:glycosyltransferase [Gammaproteobacteria bacterium]
MPHQDAGSEGQRAPPAPPADRSVSSPADAALPATGEPSGACHLSIVIPAFNEEKLIALTLGRIVAALGDCGCAEFELIVCDNASTDRTAALARVAGARVVTEQHRQIARARNTGARTARGRWLLFVDADSWPDSALMADLLRTLARDDVVGGGACLSSPGLRPRLRWILWLWNLYSRTARLAAGSFLFCRADAFEAVNGFDEALYAAEELNLSIRLKRWARSRRLRFVILHRHPVKTSPRKQNLYSVSEHCRLLLRILRAPHRVLRDRAQLYLWYDGRR